MYKRQWQGAEGGSKVPNLQSGPGRIGLIKMTGITRTGNQYQLLLSVKLEHILMLQLVWMKKIFLKDTLILECDHVGLCHSNGGSSHGWKLP